MKVFKNSIELQWDEGNIKKNNKHNVDDREAEEVFFDEHRVIFKDIIHSGNEQRFKILGKTKRLRLLFVVFTKRGRKIRIISARDINRKEVYLYEKKARITKI